ncbi:hypothetical protein, partial [Mycoplasmoides pneumoniae]|uniref:hypothetical protein n=1 Tax=Mycoplasmoides pneumoniae TaxID=2104 RepID=UPI001F49117B
FLKAKKNNQRNFFIKTSFFASKVKIAFLFYFFFFFGKPFEEKEINWNFGLTQSTLAVNCCYFCPLD